ncbi:MAG: glycosyltransferase family 4 protein [Candidatus Taylorbacteria bacterium]|nr:glycosyltransferase family 4 protein [Candidatus Taylorbacteria bacterium]
MRILIATGIYPPDVGGPAQYALNVEKVWKSLGHQVDAKTFRLERKMPAGLRHVFYFFKCLPKATRADFIFILDTWSAALPAVLLGWLFRKKIIIRVGGDFLWESYLERTGDLLPLPRFYEKRPRLNFKERIISRLTGFVLRRASRLAFNSDWQRNIMIPAYGLNPEKTSIVLNFFGEKLPFTPPACQSLSEAKAGRPAAKNFIFAARAIKLKNTDNLRRAFAEAKKKDPSLSLDERLTSHEKLFERLASCYAVILPSVSEVSPNLILDALRFSKPFILTRECGLYETLKGVGLFVDPLSVSDITEKILMLADAKTYKHYQIKARRFSFAHSWEEIAEEFLALAKRT